MHLKELLRKCAKYKTPGATALVNDVESARIMLLDDGFVPDKEAGNFSGPALDSPFECVWVENVSGIALASLSFPNKKGERVKVIQITGVLIKEISPVEAEITMVVYHKMVSTTLPYFIKGTLKNGVYTNNYESSDKEEQEMSDSVFNVTLATMEFVFKKLKDRAIFGHQNKGVTYSVGKGMNKRYKTIKDIVYIKDRKQLSDSSGTKDVDWSHSFEVMGHWRKIRGIGKDRSGSYNQKGFTWVLPHVRGEGELIIKSRVIPKITEG